MAKVTINGHSTIVAEKTRIGGANPSLRSRRAGRIIAQRIPLWTIKPPSSHIRWNPELPDGRFFKNGHPIRAMAYPPFGADAMYGGGLIHPFGSHIVAAM